MYVDYIFDDDEFLYDRKDRPVYYNPNSTLEPVYIFDIYLNAIVPRHSISGRISFGFGDDSYLLKFVFSKDLDNVRFTVLSSNEHNPKFLEYKDAIYKLLDNVLCNRILELTTKDIYVVTKPE